MTHATSSTTPSSESNSVRIIAWLITAAAFVVFAVHLTFFAIGINGAPSEAGYRGGATAVSFYELLIDLIRLNNLEAVPIARSFSIVCALSSMIVLSQLVAKWSEDVIVGASIVLGLVLFPVSAYVFALATPFALIMMLSVLALWSTTESDQQNRLLDAAIPGFCAGIIMLLDSSGIGLVLGIGLIVLVSHKDARTATVYWISFGVTVAVPLLLFPLPSTPPVMPNTTEPLVLANAEGLFFPYAMLWVAMLFSVTALTLSRALRSRMGRPLVQRAVLMKCAFGIAFLGMVLVQPTPAGRMIAFNAVLAFGILAVLPLVLWIRWIMPLIQSVWIWLLLPVVMYSCFWVVLGPIDWSGFPYDQVAP